MAESKQITVEDLDLGTESGFVSLEEARTNVERRVITEALARCGNNLTHAAKNLEITRPTLYDLMDKLGIPRK